MFLEPSFSSIEPILNKLQKNTTPRWGSMSAQRMIEHLSDNLHMAIGLGNYSLAIPVEKIEKMQSFLHSSKPMARDIKVYFAPENYTLRNTTFELAKQEFHDAWMAFESYYEDFPKQRAVHPFYGHLDKSLWLLLISKHFTHHFQQFGLID